MEIIVNVFTKAAGWSIIHSVWQGAILYTILILFFIAKPKLSSVSRHNLSFLALSGVFIWFLITFYNELAISYAGQALENARPLYLSLFNNSAPQFSSPLVYSTEQSLPWIVAVYITGIVLQIVVLICGYYRLRMIKTTGLSDLPVHINEQFTGLLRKIGIRRTVIFKLSSKVSVPMVAGYFKPVVLLPLSIMTHLHPEQLEAIIIHELSHVRRNDYLLNLFKIFIETVLFFNPFVWLTGKLIDTERENACDDLVLKITGSPLSYAQTLLELEKFKSGQQLFAMAVTGKKISSFKSHKKNS